MVVLRVGQLQLAEDAADVLLGGTLRDAQQGRDPHVGPPLGHRRQDLALAWGQRVHPIVRAARDHELGDDLRIEGGAAARDPSQGVHELADVGHAVLQQVADAAGAVGEQLGRVLPLDVLAEDEDRRARHAPAGLDRRAQPFVALRRGHPDVDHRHVGSMLHDCLDERRAIADLGHDDAPGVGDEARQPLADEGRILGDHDPERLGIHGAMMPQRPPAGTSAAIGPRVP